jgi:hypothetical protein
MSTSFLITLVTLLFVKFRQKGLQQSRDFPAKSAGFYEPRRIYQNQKNTSPVRDWSGILFAERKDTSGKPGRPWAATAISSKKVGIEHTTSVFWRLPERQKMI